MRNSTASLYCKHNQVSTMETKSKEYLDNYLDSLIESERSKYHSFSADYFCADEINANLCAELISVGQKNSDL